MVLKTWNLVLDFRAASLEVFDLETGFFEWLLIFYISI